MRVLVVEILASPLADSHPRGGASLGLAVLCIVVSGIHYVADRAIVSRIVLPFGGDLDGRANRGDLWKPPRTVRESLSVCGLDVIVFDPVGYL